MRISWASRSNRRTIVASGIALALAPPGQWARADDAYPNKPIRLVVPYPPGGGTDVIARIVQDGLARRLGQPLVIDNRGGAGGSIGTDLVAKSAADGYTLLFTLSSHAINPGLYPSLPFDTQKDFAAVSLVASLPQILIAAPGFAAATFKDMIALAREKPGDLSYGSVGNGSPSHMAGALLDLKAGTRMQHVPYRGGGPALVDVMGGQIPLAWVSVPAAAVHIKSGRVRALAVSTKTRSAVFADVPTVAESGYPDFEVDSWYAMFAPAGTPTAVIARWQKAIVETIAEPDVRDKLLGQGAEARGSTPAELDRIVATEIKMWRSLIATARIRAE